jgi:hypothetical protein
MGVIAIWMAQAAEEIGDPAILLGAVPIKSATTPFRMAATAYSLGEPPF